MVEKRTNAEVDRGINWKLASRECVTSLIHAHSYPSEDFGEIFRTRLENKIGTMTAKRVLATASEGHLNGGTPNPGEGLEVDLRGPHLRRRKVCIGPTRLSLPPPSSSLFSHYHLLLLPLFFTVLRNPPTSPADVRARRTRACPFLPLNPVGPRVVRIKKDCLTIRRGSNIALEDALVLCSTGRPSRKPALTFRTLLNDSRSHPS